MTRRQTQFQPDETGTIDYAALTDAEQAAMDAGVHYARAHDIRQPGETYCSAVTAARRAILFRILGSLARECPDGLPTPVTVDTDDPVVPERLRAGMDWTGLLRRVPDVCDTPRTLLVPFPETEMFLVAPIRAVRGFERFQFGDRAFKCDGASMTPAGSPESVVKLVDSEGVFPTEAAARAARKQVGDSVANLALALVARRIRWRELDGTPTPAATDYPTELFDRLVVSGHPLHPGAKTRRGMSPVAAFGAAPEFTSSVELEFVAVQSDWTRCESVDGRACTEHLYGQFPGLRAAVSDAVPGESDEYTIFAVHPWQLRNVVYDRYADARADGVVVPVTGYSRPAAPLLSLRTLSTRPWVADSTPPLHLKLPLDVQTTSAVRTLSPQAALTGPRVSELLGTLCDRESFDSFGVVEELAAACYHPPGDPHVEGEGYDDARNLGTLVRQAPSTHPIVSEDDAVVTAASLLSRPPNGAQSVLSALLESFADQTTHRNPADAFLQAYLDAVVPGPLSLLVAHGVGFEAHLQNTSVVFDGGRPTAALIGDFGAIRLHEPRAPDEVRPYPGSDVYTSDPAVVRRELWNTLFQHHLGELIGRLSTTTRLEPEACWSAVRQTCERVFDRLAADDRIPRDRVRADRASLFDDRMQHLSMTETWFRDAEEYCLTTVPNPLAAADH